MRASSAATTAPTTIGSVPAHAERVPAGLGGRLERLEHEQRRQAREDDQHLLRMLGAQPASTISRLPPSAPTIAPTVLAA